MTASPEASKVELAGNVAQLFDGVSISSFSGSGLSVAWLQADAGAAVPPHRHLQEQITVVIVGAVRITTPNAVMDLGPGQAIHLPSWVLHSAEVISDATYIDVFHPMRGDFGAIGSEPIRETE